MGGASKWADKGNSGGSRGRISSRTSVKRLSMIFAGALFLCALILMNFFYFKFIPPLSRPLLSVFLWLLVVTAYVFHLLSLWAHEQELLREHSQEMRRVLFETVESLVAVLEVRDPFTGGHQRRVAKLARAIAESMGLSEDRVEGVVLAASIHDVGKVRIPPSILTKRGQLSEEEYEVIRTHPQVGADIVKSVEFPMPVAEIVRQHHERLDGTGYGSGLTEEDILPEAKILAVADCVEAMASDRPYRRALGIDKALQEISEKKGAFYDPDVVEVCAALFREKGFAFEKQPAVEDVNAGVEQ